MPGNTGFKKTVPPESQDAAIAGLAFYLGIVIITSLKEVAPGTGGLLLSSALQLVVAVSVAYLFTRWQRAERRCQEQTDAVLAVPKVAILTADPTGVITTWNVGAEAIFGYKLEEAIGASIGILYTQPDVAEGKWQESLHDAETRGIADENAWRLRKNGSRFWANMVVSAVLDRDRKASKFVILARDFTAWKIGTDHVVDQCMTLETIVEGTFQIISLKNAILRYEFINAAGALHFGSSQEEIAGKTDAEVMPAAMAEVSAAYDDKVLRTGSPLIVVEEHELHGAKRRYLAYRSPWRNAAGKTHGVITISTDITDRLDLSPTRARGSRKQTESRQTLFDGEPPVSIQ